MNSGIPTLTRAFMVFSVFGFVGALVLNVLSLLSVDTGQPGIVIALNLSCVPAVLFTIYTAAGLPVSFFDKLKEVIPFSFRPWMGAFVYVFIMFFYQGTLGGQGKWVEGEYRAAITDTSPGTVALFSSFWILCHSAVADFLYSVYKTNEAIGKSMGKAK